MADMETTVINEENKEERLFTQEEVNRIVRERLRKEKQKKQPEEENTALHEIDETDEQESKSELPKEIRASGHSGDLVITEPSDIKKFCEICGVMDEYPTGLVKEFMDWKQYAEDNETEIKPVDPMVLAEWRAKNSSERMRPIGGGVYRTSTEDRADAFMRKAFGLPEKKTR